MQKTSFYEGRLPGQVGEPYWGKVRDIYDIGDLLVCVTSDRISAYNHNLPFTVKDKGIILNQIAVEMMEATKDIIPNCFLGMANPRTAIWRKLNPIKLEFIVRGYMEGSYWREFYSKGIKDPWGYELPKGLKYQQKLPEVIITPTRKTEDDESISWGQIKQEKIMTPQECLYVMGICEKLFACGQEIAAKKGLIMIDTKYEFGKDADGKIYLIDEIHTPDSSRYYYAPYYEDNFKAGNPQVQLSKEFVRQFLADNGFTGKLGQTMPDFTADKIKEIEDNYKELYEKLMGKKLDVESLPDIGVEFGQLKYAIGIARAIVSKPVVGIVMGSDSDLEVMKGAAEFLLEHRVSFELGILSAHRTPLDVEKYASNALAKGLKVIIAGAGGAAHLPGMLAASTVLPVIGVPVQQKTSTAELDSLLSIVQMPPGVPVATVGINRAQNASVLAIQILATSDPILLAVLVEYKKELIAGVRQKRTDLSRQYPFNF